MPKPRSAAAHVFAWIMALGCGAVVLLACAINAAGQEVRHEAVIQPTVRMTPKNVILVVDCSGSMRGEQLGRALELVDEIAQQPVDEWRLGAVAFAHTGLRWPGTDGEGWADMPDAHATHALLRWLRQARPGSHQTVAWKGIELATREVPEGGLLVVVVSDGEWGDFPYVQASLPGRMVEGLSIAAFSVAHEDARIGLAEDQGDDEELVPESMRWLGQIGGAGCWR